jgi:pimeloyl-ACP methyl ester carboxylesterase
MSTSETKVFFDTAKTTYADQTFTFNGFKIHYIQTGNKQKPTLFFVHGSPGSWDAYKDYLKDSLLLKKYRLIAIDRPGFGYSDFGSAEDLQVQALHISRFLKTIDNQKPIVLIGHSMGGPVVVKMATLEPKRYRHLVILAGAIDPKAEKPEIWRYFIMKKPIRYLIPGALRPANDELWWLKSDLIDMKPTLKNIISDITIIHGTKDPLVPYSNMAFMQKEFINAKSIHTIPIENANHFIPWEHYDEIRNVLLDLKF